MSDNFYITGGTLPLDAPSYVERRADAELLDGLRRGEFCYVLDTRQMGKSSLMVRTARRLKEEGCRVAVLDLTAFGQNLSVEQWYSGLLGRTAAQTGQMPELLAFWKEHRELGPMQRFLEALRHVLLTPSSEGDAVADLVLFVDEIDAVRGLPFSADEFFGGIRECFNRRPQDPAFARLTFCLLGVAAPTDLVRDTRLSPFNIGRRIELRDFTPEEAGPLGGGLGGVRKRAHRLLRRILFWTHGHPYMTQRLCRGVAEALRAGGGRRGDNALVDGLCRDLFLAPAARETDDNLAFVRNRLLHSEADPATLLDFYLKIRRGRRVRDDTADPLCSLLRLSGVVAPIQGWLAVRNRVYRSVFDSVWVQANLPAAEVRRQHQAYQRGVLRTGIIAATIILVVTLLALSNAKNARQAREQARRTQQLASIVRDQKNRADENARALAGALGQVRWSESASLERANQLAITLATARQLRKDAQGSAAQAVAKARLAAIKTQEADRNAAAAGRATGRALRDEAVTRNEEALVGARLSRAYVETGTRLMDAGDDGAALAPLVEAMRLGAGDPAQHRRRIASALALAPRLDRVWFAGGPLRWACLSPDRTCAAAGGEDGRAHLWDVRTGQELPLAVTHAEALTNIGAITGGAFSPDGTRLAVCGTGDCARIWDIRARRLLWTLRPLISPAERGQSRPAYACWSRDGRRLATACGDIVAVWDIAGAARSGLPRAEMRLPIRGAHLDGVALAPDGKSLAFVAGDNLGEEVSVPSGQFLSALGSPALGGCYNGKQVAYSRDGNRVLVAGGFGGSGIGHPGACVFSALTTGGHLSRQMLPLLPHDSRALYAAYSPDESRIATASEDGTARIWDAATGQAVTPPLMSGQPVVHVEFSPDGRRVVTACTDGTARVWNADTGGLVCAPLRHAGALVTAQFTVDGGHVFTAGRDGTARLWTMPSAPPKHDFQMAQMPYYALLAGDTRLILFTDHVLDYDLVAGRLLLPLPGIKSQFSTSAGTHFLVTWAEDTTQGGPHAARRNPQAFQVWDALMGRPVSAPVHAAQVFLSPDGDALLLYGPDGILRLLDPTAQRPLLPPLHGVKPVPPSCDPFTPDGRAFLVQNSPESVRLIDRRTGLPLTLPLRHPSLVTQWAFSPDSHFLFTQTTQAGGKQARAWDLTSNPPRQGPPSPVNGGAAFSPDGRVAILPGGAAGFLRWRLDGPDPLRPRSFQTLSNNGYVFSHDGRSFVVREETRWLWDTDTLRPVPLSVNYGEKAKDAAFSPDGRRVLVALEDGTAAFWDTRTGHPLTPILPQSRVQRAAFTADGEMAATAGADGTVRVWDAHTGEALTPPLTTLTPHHGPTGLTFTDADHLLVTWQDGATIWSVPTTAESLPRLLARAHLLSGHRIDLDLGPIPTDPARLRADWALVGDRR